MPKFMTVEQAVEVVRDGDVVATNDFLTLVNSRELKGALGERFQKTGHPKDLTLWCSAGFGDWFKDSPCELPITSGAVTKVYASHYGSTPHTAAKILANELEAYNFPLSIMSHGLRAAAAKRPFHLSPIGQNLFADPDICGYRLNERSKEHLVDAVELDGVRMLKYKAPKLDVALIKATYSDMQGNISFDQEPVVADALLLAQAVHNNGGTVIVQVEKVLDTAIRPWNCIIPAALVDIVAECPEQTQIASRDGYIPIISGERKPSQQELEEMVYGSERGGQKELARTVVAKRAVKELHEGDIINIGIGMPEGVAVEAARLDMLDKVHLTVETGSISGLPTSGELFGASAGPKSIYSISQQFDFYGGGGLDICFLGCLEVDVHGNVNSHYSTKKLSGIGGFADISQSTKEVVFCFTLTASGLEIALDGDKVSIAKEGKIKKIVPEVQAISFSAKNARASGQTVLYVTERCVFKLGEHGLELIEVFEGIDPERDIYPYLPEGFPRMK